jgi:hypothetical protein
MNKRSVKKQVAKPSRSAVIHKAVLRRASAKSEISHPVKIAGPNGSRPLPMRAAVLRAHRFRVGQTVLYTSSPISRPGASGTYIVVKLLPSDGEDYQYRIKNADEAFERVAKESQLEVEH